MLIRLLIFGIVLLPVFWLVFKLARKSWNSITLAENKKAKLDKEVNNVIQLRRKVSEINQLDELHNLTKNIDKKEVKRKRKEIKDVLDI